jgi:hypothetical protein
MSATLETAPIPTISTRTAAVRYYRLAVLVLAVALAAMIAATLYLAAQPTPTAGPSSPPTFSGVECLPPGPC